MKKKLPEIKSVAVERYITFMDYFATGEGRTIEINFCYAATRKEAIENHRLRFYPGNMDAWYYFGVGVEVAKVDSKRAKEIITGVFNNSESILDALKNAGVELHFRFYFNFN